MNEFKIKKGLIVQGSGSLFPILDIQGSQGELFSVTDSLSGSLSSVNDISGLPILEVFSDDTVKMGTYNAEGLIVSGSTIKIGRLSTNVHTVTGSFNISGSVNVVNGVINNLTASFAVSASRAVSSSIATNVAYSGLTGTVPTWNQSTTGNAATATVAGGIRGPGGSAIISTTSGTSYSNHIQVREAEGGTSNTSSIYAPALGFHWGGIVASNIIMETTGRIAITNNPGTSYENFVANIVYGGTSVQTPILYDLNSTGYYLDPALTSNLNAANFVGPVGIGTTSPNAKTTIASSSPEALSIYRDLDVNAVGPAGLYFDLGARVGSTFTSAARIQGVLNTSTTGTLDFLTRDSGGLSTKVTIASNGNVGIGTSGPAQKLTVVGNISIDGTSNSYALKNAGSQCSFYGVSNSPSEYSWASTAGDVVLQVGQTGGYIANRLILSNQNNGDILYTFGTTSTNDAEKFRMVKDGTFNTVKVVASTSVTAPIYYDSDSTAYYVNPASTSVLNTLQVGVSITAPIYYDPNNASYYLDLASSGDSIRVAGDIVAYYSDERLKDKKGNIENPLEKVLSLNGFYYEPNEKAQQLGYIKKMEVGVSAQEVEAVMPEIVKDAPIGHGYKTLNYAKLVPLLIEAIKEQQTQIEEIKRNCKCYE